jgi:hypothetical protein
VKEEVDSRFETVHETLQIDRDERPLWSGATQNLCNLRMMLSSTAEDGDAGPVPTAENAASVFVAAAALALR